MDAGDITSLIATIEELGGQYEVKRIDMAKYMREELESHGGVQTRPFNASWLTIRSVAETGHVMIVDHAC